MENLQLELHVSNGIVQINFILCGFHIAAKARKHTLVIFWQIKASTGFVFNCKIVRKLLKYGYLFLVNVNSRHSFPANTCKFEEEKNRTVDMLSLFKVFW